MKKLWITNMIGCALLLNGAILRAENNVYFNSDTLETIKTEDEKNYTPVEVGGKEVFVSEDGEKVLLPESETYELPDSETLELPDLETLEIEKIHQVFKADDNSTVIIGDKEIIKIKEGGDTTRIKIGKKGITIIEENDNAFIDIDEIDDDDFFDKEDDKFKGHWAGFEFGLNNYLNADFSLSRNSENEFMDVNTSKSFGFNFNIAQYSLGLGTDKIGLVTGLGFEWNHYHFDNLNTITKSNGIIIADTLSPTPNKSKLSTFYFNVPLLLEFQIGGEDRSDRVHISAGVVGGAKLGSYTKTVYKGDTKDKDKVKDDFNLSPFRYGITARVGFKALNLYAVYYPTPLFEKNKGPELYPIHAGVSFLF